MDPFELQYPSQIKRVFVCIRLKYSLVCNAMLLSGRVLLFYITTDRNVVISEIV